VFQPFWDYQNGKLTQEDWQGQFDRAKVAVQTALGRQDTATVIGIALSRIYTLRNQLIHGGATWGSSVNRDQIRDCVALMKKLVPSIDPAKNTAYELCFFSVNERGAATKFYIDNGTLLSKAWEQAVSCWGNVYEIRPKDVAYKLTLAPSPDQFKALRKQLNNQEGHDFPASVLHHVYAEQRDQLGKRKARENTHERFDGDELLSLYANLEREVSEYIK
jgi:hypothetical protein